MGLFEKIGALILIVIRVIAMVFIWIINKIF